MRRFIVVGLLVWLGFVYYQQSHPQVYAQFSDIQPDLSRGEQVLYFWVSSKHSSLFQVGRSYQLIGKQHRAQLELSSVSYAQIQPDSVKLGFRQPLAENFVPQTDAYLVTIAQQGEQVSAQP